MGGGSGTSKIHYYRIDNEAIINEFRDLGYENDMIVTFCGEYFVVADSHIYNADDTVARIHYRGITPIIDSMWGVFRVKALLVAEDIYFGQYPYITKGDLYTKIDYYIKTFSEEEATILKPAFDICLKHTTEITEDEFWGMCDVAITPLPE